MKRFELYSKIQMYGIVLISLIFTIAVIHFSTGFPKFLFNTMIAVPFLLATNWLYYSAVSNIFYGHSKSR